MCAINNVFTAYLPFSVFANNKIHMDDTKPELCLEVKQASIYISLQFYVCSFTQYICHRSNYVCMKTHAKRTIPGYLTASIIR